MIFGLCNPIKAGQKGKKLAEIFVKILSQKCAPVFLVIPKYNLSILVNKDTRGLVTFVGIN